MDVEAMQTFVKIIENFDDTPLCKRQEASISIVAINTAASPPNKKNVKKTIESEKFRIYFDLGKVILILVAIKIVETNKKANDHEKISSFNRKEDRAKLEIPKTAIRVL